MPQSNNHLDGRSQDLILPPGKILVSRASLNEMLKLLALTTPVVGSPQPPDRHWNAIKTVRLRRCQKMLRRALAGGRKALKEKVDE